MSKRKYGMEQSSKKFTCAVFNAFESYSRHLSKDASFEKLFDFAFRSLSFFFFFCFLMRISRRFYEREREVLCRFVIFQSP